MTESRVQVLVRMLRSERKALRKYTVDNDITVQDFVESAIKAAMKSHGIKVEYENAPREPIVSQCSGGDWFVMGGGPDNSEWRSEGFSTQAAAYRWLDRYNEEVTSPSEKRSDYHWGKQFP